MSILNRKRAKKRRMKYIEAMRAMKAYENGELRLKKVIDNVLNPNKSISKNCQVPHCGQAIRWEYVMENKDTGDIMIVGSTCVWELLEMTKEQIKEFEKIERTIKDFHAMLLWRAANRDVYDKIMELKKRQVMSFWMFWDEVDYAPLDQEDTDYIRAIDVDREERKYKAVKNAQVNKKQQDEIAYQRVLESLERMVNETPDNLFLRSLKTQAGIKHLSDKQIACIKREANLRYYLRVVKNNTQLQEKYNNCPAYMKAKVEEWVQAGTIPGLAETLQRSRSLQETIERHKQEINIILGRQLEWELFRLRNNIFLR